MAVKLKRSIKKHLTISHQLVLNTGFDVHNFDGAPRWLFVKDMAGLTEEDLWKSYGKDAKYDIKKTWEYGVTTRELRYEELPL